MVVHEASEHWMQQIVDAAAALNAAAAFVSPLPSELHRLDDAGYSRHGSVLEDEDGEDY